MSVQRYSTPNPLPCAMRRSRASRTGGWRVGALWWADRRTSMRDLGKQFDAAMFEIYRRAKSEAGYNATIFLRMVSDKGGLTTARYLINSARPSDGYTHLYERGRLDLTVEAMVAENAKWHELFTGKEVVAATSRLKKYGYSPRTASVPTVVKPKMNVLDARNSTGRGGVP